MMGLAPWLGVYAGIIALWLFALAVGRRPTLWKGRSLLILNVGFVVVVVVTAITRGERPGVALATFVVSIIAVGVVASRLWILLHIDREGARQVVEKCLAQTLAKYEGNAGRYIVHTAGEDMTIDISGNAPVMRVRITGGRGSKKAVLIRSLFGKQFSGSVPKLRVRT